MSGSVIEVHDLSKEFTIRRHAGVLRKRTLTEELWARIRNLNVSIGRGRREESQATEASFWALRNVSFEVEQGSRLGIIGRNGAGKSTLLKILSRITGPTSGKIHIKGRVISLLEIGVGFHAELTGRENIFLNGALLGMRKYEIRKKFDEIVDFAEIESFLDTPVKRYSSGMYMKLAFAIAAHLEPEILIVDEVLAVGDARFQKKCLGKMEGISKGEGRTVLFVSHNIEAIRTLCTGGILLDKGQLVAQGDIRSVVETYVSSYTDVMAEFIPESYKPVFFNAIRLPENRIVFGEDLIIECEIGADRIINDYSIGLGISNVLGARVGSVLLQSLRPLRKGINRIGLRVPILALVPGDYKLTLAIVLQEVDIQDVVTDYPLFSILSDQRNAGLFSKWHDSWGDVILDGAGFLSD